jgi:hypothetical protein
MALSIQYIIRRTDPQRKADSANVRILARKVGYTPEGYGFIAAQTQSNYRRMPDGRLVRVTGNDKYVTVITILNKKMHAKVSCSCPDFTYRWEVALEDRGSADIEYSNGDAPTITNPVLVPACCKHLVALYESVKTKLVPKA